MSSYKKYQTFSVPNKVLELELSDELLADLIRLLSYNQEYIKISQITTISRDNLSTLSSRGIVEITDQDGHFVVDLNPLYGKLYGQSTSATNTTYATTDVLDRIEFLLSRKLKPIEIDRINKWLTQGYEVSEVEQAVYKSSLNSADNFNYIETVLFNATTPQKEEKKTHVKRNVDLY